MGITSTNRQNRTVPTREAPARPPLHESETAASNVPTSSHIDAKTAVRDEMAGPGRSLVKDVAHVKNVDTVDVINDRQHDGAFVGGDGKTYPAHTPLSDIPPMTPNNGVVAKATVIHINGIMTDVALQRSDMQALANTGLNVIGIHNATSGMFADLAQCVGDKLDLEIANNNAVRTLGDTLYKSLTAGEPVHIVGHSQGALVISRALTDVKNRLMAEDGLSKTQATAVLSKLTVETFGGAANHFPDGPSFTHHVNVFDAVPVLTGVGTCEENLLAKPGAGAVVHTYQEVGELRNMPSVWSGLTNWLARAVDRAVYGPQDIYFRHRTER